MLDLLRQLLRQRFVVRRAVAVAAAVAIAGVLGVALLVLVELDGGEHRVHDADGAPEEEEDEEAGGAGRYIPLTFYLLPLTSYAYTYQVP